MNKKENLPRTTRTNNIKFLTTGSWCLCGLWLIIILLFPVTLNAADFGLVLNQYGSFGNEINEDGGFEYTGSFIPYFSALIGTQSSFYIAAGITINYNDDATIIPELLRTEYFTKPGSWELSMGRIGYSDPLGFIASGLFDGLRVTHSSSSGTFGIGAFYTGLLYKETANITMTVSDKANYDTEFTFDDFANTYFAPRRIIAAIDWDNYVFNSRLRLKAAITGQFDLTDADTKLHSQYLILKMGIPAGRLIFEAGGSLSAMETITAVDTEFSLALAGELGVHWLIPAEFNNRLSFTARYAGGYANDIFGAFIPVTTAYYGNIFQAKMSSLSVLGLSYAARIIEPVGLNLSAQYFMRHDLSTPNNFITPDSDDFLLGAEFFARVIWSPVSDLQFILGGGAFLPSLGNVWENDSAKWKADLTVILSL